MDTMVIDRGPFVAMVYIVIFNGRRDRRIENVYDIIGTAAEDEFKYAGGLKSNEMNCPYGG